jgi:hypothetical protein
MKRRLMLTTMLLVTALVACASPRPAATPVPPTEPAATAPAEIVATRPEDIAGVWFLKWFGQGGLVIFPARLTFRQDGTFSLDEKDEPMHIFDGSLRFADGQVTLDSEGCYNEVKALFYHCTITFAIYAVLQDGRPVSIRMVSAGDKGVFVNNVNNKTLLLDAP